MAATDSELRHRKAQQGVLTASAPSVTTAKGASQSESDLTFYAFFAAVLNAATALLVAFTYGIYYPFLQDEVEILIATSALSVVAAAVVGALSWRFPIVGTAFLGGILMGIAYLFGFLAIYGDDDNPVGVFYHGWMVSGVLLYVVMKSNLWRPF